MKLIETIIKKCLKEQNSMLNNDIYQDILKLRSDLIIAAQKVYSEWEQDEDGYDEVYGEGGICDAMADAMADVVNEKTKWGVFHLYNESDCHTSIYVYDNKSQKIYNVDIPPYVYERGTGYNWKKISDVTFKVDNIEINEVDWDDFMDEDGSVRDDLMS